VSVILEPHFSDERSVQNPSRSSVIFANDLTADMAFCTTTTLKAIPFHHGGPYCNGMVVLNTHLPALVYLLEKIRIASYSITYTVRRISSRCPGEPTPPDSPDSYMEESIPPGTTNCALKILLQHIRNLRESVSRKVVPDSHYWLFFAGIY